MTKNEMKKIKNKIGKAKENIKTEIKALQRAIDRGLRGDTGMVMGAFTKLSEELSGLKQASH